MYLSSLTMREKLTAIYETLFARYGDLHWWPAKTPYEVIVGAVLTQNTAWGNVEKAIANFGGGLTPQTVADAELAELTKIIRPAGFFNQKAVYLKAVTAWYSGYGYEVPAVRRESLAKLRAELLATRGVGQETADSILLYAFGFPTFVVDAYTMRLCARCPIEAGGQAGLAPAAGGPAVIGGSRGGGYAAVKAIFENALPRSAEIYNHFHALIVINAKNYCRKRNPSCGECPLAGVCAKQISPS